MTTGEISSTDYVSRETPVAMRSSFAVGVRTVMHFSQQLIINRAVASTIFNQLII